jgi:hypothetical protein
LADLMQAMKAAGIPGKPHHFMNKADEPDRPEGMRSGRNTKSA